MTKSQKEDFIRWLGSLYLDFDNAHVYYIEVTEKEILKKLDSYK